MFVLLGVLPRASNKDGEENRNGLWDGFENRGLLGLLIRKNG